jgi:hypothetical protein
MRPWWRSWADGRPEATGNGERGLPPSPPLRRSLAEQVEDPDGMVSRLRLGGIGEQLASLPSAST